MKNPTSCSSIRFPSSRLSWLPKLLGCLGAVLLGAVSSPSQAAEVLFVRGADRSGGLSSGTDNTLTRQLADIDDTGNRGWNELRLTLEANGFGVTQIIEPLEPGAPATGPTEGAGIAFDLMDLSAYDVIVFGSNNAVYSTAAVDAVESFIREGGGAVFISDANFGGDWADAPDSDQQFLGRFGLIMHQDLGTYVITRSEGEFLVPNHPIFTGVDSFDGEGVSPIEVGEPTPGVEVTLLALAEGNMRLNEPPFGANNKGPTRPAGPADASLLLARADQGCILGHFDRNSFYNTGGVGTDISRFDNRALAINLFKTAAGMLPCGAEPDSDGDGVPDEADNCTEVPNPDQSDFDAGMDDDASLPGVQHYGDACDADLDDDGVVGSADFFAVFRPCMGADIGIVPACAEADLDGDGVIAASDFFLVLRPSMGATPGPGVTEP